MANTNPLAAMKIKKLIGFKQITPGVITDDLITALIQCGIDVVTSYTNYNSVMSAGQMNVLGNTFYGLKFSTAKGSNNGLFTITLFNDAGKLKEHPVQVGLRLTQSATGTKVKNTDVLAIYNNSGISLTPKITTNKEDTSAYYEFVLSAVKDSYGNYKVAVDVYVNKQKFSTGNSSLFSGRSVFINLGSTFTVDVDAGFSYMVGDMYFAELDYNSDGTVTPQLLGNLTLEPFTVASYAGDKHTNTKNQDIVTALNTLDPNNDLGVLAIKPVEQAASVTFNVPDIAGKSIYGAALNIVYKDSIAPNNRLSYQITEGTTQLPEQTITESNADIVGYTTFSKILTTPANGGDWNAENLKFKLDMVNRGADAE
ncbi:TPA_asm: hypothetical protein GND69_004772 [Salmonella enterica subsp. diarizonae serovar 48:i:z]|uniref:Uncharacterized protein n=1 Tax=Salmonella enterica subsp. diarizonae serovar 48:i:z TaxID=1192842 RepID=A0A735RMB1_SALDZ|nr:hypothetical protein [Salmonella enterica subsp. diarizonae serovar 48:i:z]